MQFFFTLFIFRTKQRPQIKPLSPEPKGRKNFFFRRFNFLKARFNFFFRRLIFLKARYNFLKCRFGNAETAFAAAFPLS